MQENDAMALHDILVVLDGTSRDEATLGVAAWLARRHDAHLTGFCPLELLYPASLGLAISGYGELPLLEETIGQLTAEAEKSAALIETTFRERLRRDDLRGDWQVAHGYATQAVSRRSRTADLLVISQTDARHPLPVNANGLIEDVLIGSGRPMLLVPYAGRFETVGANVLIGWSGTREAARAVHDALPLMTRESVVTILTVEQSNDASGPMDIPGAELAEHLARHGVNVSSARTVADGISAGDAILSYAADAGADLLVMGGYGHSRARQMILGGVSRELLKHMTLPVLMSH
jgi:nucleotide-binding universal stress UspA family protein